MAASLDQAVRRGTRSVLFAQILSQVISLIVLGVLYRLVTPAEFGLIGMVTPLLMLARLLASFGLQVAAVQHPDLDDTTRNTLFWGNQWLSLAAVIVTAAAGPGLAALYQTPALTQLCLVLSGTLLLFGLANQHQAFLERELRLGRLVLCRLVAQVLAGVAAIVVAWRGAGVWALVTQQYVELATLAVAVWIAEPWRPGRPRFDRKAQGLFRFGGYYSGSSLFFFIAQHADKVLLATWLGGSAAGQTALGLYSQAFNLMMKPVYLVTAPISGVLLPALSRARNRAGEFAELVVRFFRITAIVLFPCAVGIALVAEELLTIVAGEPWRFAGRLLAILAPTVLIQGLVNLCGSLLASKGRADRLFLGALVSAVLLMQGYLAAYFFHQQFGETANDLALAVAASFTFVSVGVISLPYLYFALSSAQVAWRTVANAVRFPLIVSTCMGIVVATIGRLFDDDQAKLRVSVQIFTGVVLYTSLARNEIRWMWSQIRDLRGS